MSEPPREHTGLSIEMAKANLIRDIDAKIITAVDLIFIPYDAIFVTPPTPESLAYGPPNLVILSTSPDFQEMRQALETTNFKMRDGNAYFVHLAILWRSEDRATTYGAFIKPPGWFSFGKRDGFFNNQTVHVSGPLVRWAEDVLEREGVK